MRNGGGMGFAKPAELNHYPGPKHVLQLADELGLTASQRAATNTLHDEMQQKAIVLGDELLQQEYKLDSLFSGQNADAQNLRTILEQIGQLRAKLRYVHLEAHLRQKEILDARQVEEYDRLRGYVDHTQHHGSGDRS